MNTVQEQLDKYLYAQKHAPHPEKDAYEAVLRSKPAKPVMGGIVGQDMGGDRVLAAGPSPNGGIEMMVLKRDGVVVLLMPDLMQVKNTPKGPKNYKPQRPLELPLVRRIKPTEMLMAMCRARGQPVPAALLLFQGRFSTAARELNLL